MAHGGATGGVFDESATPPKILITILTLFLMMNVSKIFTQ